MENKYLSKIAGCLPTKKAAKRLVAGGLVAIALATLPACQTTGAVGDLYGNGHRSAMYHGGENGGPDGGGKDSGGSI